MKWLFEETLSELRSAQLIIKMLQRELNSYDMAGPWSTVHEIGMELKTIN
jgi:hypothetical protein